MFNYQEITKLVEQEPTPINIIKLADYLVKNPTRCSVVSTSATGIEEKKFLRDKVLLKYRDVKDKQGYSALHHAVLLGDNTVIDMLMNHEVGSFCDEAIPSPLHLAAKNGNLNVIKKLLDLGAFINQRAFCLPQNNFFANLDLSYQGFLPQYKAFLSLSVLDCAALFGHLPVVQFLLENGAASFYKKTIVFVPEQRKLSYPSVLHYAVMSHNLELCRYLLKNYDFDHSVDSHNETPFHYAVRFGLLPIIQLFLEKNENISLVHQENKEGLSCIHLAASHDHVDILRVLIEKAGLNNAAAVVENEWSYLDESYAVLEEQGILNFSTAIRTELSSNIEIEDDVFSLAKKGSPLYHALIKKNPKVINYFFQEHVDLSQEANHSYPILRVAKKIADIKLIQFVIECFLEQAVRHSKTKIVDFMLDLSTKPLTNNLLDMMNDPQINHTIKQLLVNYTKRFTHKNPKKRKLLS
jgi:ankyrin repeat protein/hemoglobin-like flavoprotein